MREVLITLALLHGAALLLSATVTDEQRIWALEREIDQLREDGNVRDGLRVARERCRLAEKHFGENALETAGAVNDLAEMNKMAGEYRVAEPLFQRALALRERILGAQHPDTALSLSDLAELYKAMGDYAKAEPLYQRALLIREQSSPPDELETATSLNDLAGFYEAQGSCAKAKPLAERALAIRENVAGSESRAAAESLSNLARIHLGLGEVPKARELAQRALQIRENLLGPNHSETAESLHDLGEIRYAAGNALAEAKELFERALRIRENALGPEHPETNDTLNDLGMIYLGLDDYGRAEPALQRVFHNNEKKLGPNHPLTLTAMENLAAMYLTHGEYEKAEPLSEHALSAAEKFLTVENPIHITITTTLGQIYLHRGKHAKAKRLFERVLSLSEKVSGPDHPATAGSLNDLADVDLAMGEFAEAEPLYQRGLRIVEKASGSEELKLTLLIGLGRLYYSIADWSKAESVARQALELSEKVRGPDHSGTSYCLNNLGTVYTAMLAYDKAEPLLQRSLAIRQKTLGPEHDLTIQAFNNLGQLYYEMHLLDKAEPLFLRALEGAEKVLSADYPLTGAILNNLAHLHQVKGDYKDAATFYQRSIQSRDRSLGREHPVTFRCRHDFALMRAEEGKIEEAKKLATEVSEQSEKYLSQILSFTSERQRLEFQKTTKPYSLFVSVGSARDLARTVLRQKGVVLDSLLEDRLVAEASNDPKQRDVIEQLSAAKQALMQFVLDVPKDLSEAAQKKRITEKEERSREIEQLEAGLARQMAGLGKARRALRVTVEEVQRALPRHEALVELVRYDHSLGKNTFEPRYGAVVIPASGEPRWVPLGTAAEIEKKVQLYRKSARGESDQATLSTVLKALCELVWAPIEKALPAETTTVVLSPDAELSFVSFATLLTSDDRFLGEKYSIRYVASGRDLLKESKPRPSSISSMRIFADPDFAGGTGVLAQAKTDVVALRSQEMRDLQSISLPSLPGTAKESAELEMRAKKSGWQFRSNLGSEATEAELRKVSAPRVLHLATHGFFLSKGNLGPPGSSLAEADDIPKGILVNPMHRSGLAVAGAQTTLQSWARGEVPPTENDGIVTAEEVGGLRLKDTWLVTLSACDTASGEAKAGEGVMGLRRGFVQAGAQNLLMTLWPISDETTVEIMLDFYDAAFKSGNAPQALADTQRDWMVKLRKDRGLQAAVQLAGPFIISSQGK